MGATSQPCNTGSMARHRGLITELKKMGYKVEVSNNAHYKVRRPNGSYLMTMSLSPGDINAEKQARRLFERLTREESSE